MTYTTTDEVDDNMGGVTGAMGALDPDSKDADAHAKMYYESVRNRHSDSDIKNIARNTGLPERVVAEVKHHVFVAENHDLGDGVIDRFKPNFKMAQAWQRMDTNKGITDMDILLLKHEFRESIFMRKYGYNYPKAHIEANKFFNWAAIAYPKEEKDV